MNDRYDEEIESRKEQKAARKISSKKDRSQYKKTDLKKREKLLHEETQKKLAKQDLIKGRVLAISPEGITVQHLDEFYMCILKGTLKQTWSQSKNLVTVGDFVLFIKEPGNKGSIAHIEERHSVLARQEHLRRRQQQLIAANIDQVLITVSLVSPPLKPSLVDRYIIATFKGNMEPVIVVNKTDLMSSNHEKAFFELFIKTYKALHIPVIPVSAFTGEGIEALKKQMQNKSSVFSGQSGVGKSSLINAVTGLDLLVGDVVEKTQKGSHTTTSAHLIPLIFGGWCIDTPGIRSFGVWDLRKEDLNTYFPEITEIGYGCKYANCTHTHEPECALTQAVEDGKISPLRFESYLKLLVEIS
jgi:ribosome biogenesis GTPase / thiamine phosphate phosphatase